jgi:hypothetical protein
MFGWFRSKPHAESVKTVPIAALAEALHAVDTFEGAPTDFSLLIDDSLNDSIGVNMALITDKILARGWEPNGFTQEQGYRVYRYKEFA